MCVYVMYYNFISKYIDLYTTDLYALTSRPSVGADPEALACPTCWMSVGLIQRRRDPGRGIMAQGADRTPSTLRLFSVHCQALQSSCTWLKGIVNYIT